MATCDPFTEATRMWSVESTAVLHVACMSTGVGSLPSSVRCGLYMTHWLAAFCTTITRSSRARAL